MESSLLIKVINTLYFRKFYGRYDYLVHYNTQFLCDLVLCWCVLHTPDFTPLDMTGYTLDSTAGAWPEQQKFTLPRHTLFSHLGFPVFVLSWVQHLFPALSWLWTINEVWLTDDQLGSRVVRAVAPCLGGPGSIQAKDFKLVVEAPLTSARHIKA